MITGGEEKRDKPIDLIRRAHNLVAEAAERWNAGSFPAVEECLAKLQESAAELRTARSMAVENADSLRGRRDEILQIKGRVAGIERLSDLAAAFLCVGSASAGNSPLYRAGGAEDICYSSRPATKGIQA
jgi:hypothetical protein